MNDINLESILQSLLDKISNLENKVEDLKIDNKSVAQEVEELRRRLDQEGQLSCFEPLD